MLFRWRYPGKIESSVDETAGRAKMIGAKGTIGSRHIFKATLCV